MFFGYREIENLGIPSYWILLFFLPNVEIPWTKYDDIPFVRSCELFFGIFIGFAIFYDVFFTVPINMWFTVPLDLSGCFIMVNAPH